MNTFMSNLTNENNYDYTENGALKYKSTKSAILDMFSLCGSYRNRTDEDCILAFKNALEENESLAMKCLFYLRDCRGGQGERRFFRVCFRWLASSKWIEAARRNLSYVSEYGRWDDLIYTCIGTPLENDTLSIIKHQLALDIDCKIPSLLAKWLPSENASSAETKRMGNIVRAYLGMNHKEYRKTLSVLRSRINIVEKLMSENRWDEIEFDKIPSKAGLVYRNAFARRDILAKKYETFIRDENTKVNADTLYPYEIVRKAIANSDLIGSVDRAAIEKYWNNQIDYLEGKPCKMMCVVDTSGSMTWSVAGNIRPIDVAISLGMYCAERIGGDFKNHYISFSSRPQLINIEGIDFVDKVHRIYRTNLCDNTDLVRTFELLRVISLNSKPEDRPNTIVVISDMEIDEGCGYWRTGSDQTLTEMEKERKIWEKSGLEMPRLIYWNVNARNNTFLEMGNNIAFVSGASPTLFKQILTGKTGVDLMLEVLTGERYSQIQ